MADIKRHPKRQGYLASVSDFFSPSILLIYSEKHTGMEI